MLNLRQSISSRNGCKSSGYIIAPAALAAPLLATHTAVNFCAPTPLQKASAAAFQKAEETGYFEWLSGMMQEKRDKLVKVLQEVGLKPVVPEGGYFVICDASILLDAAGISIGNPAPETPLEERPDVKICKWMTQHVGVTAIPVSPFYLPESRHHGNRLIRLAFCKDEATMSLAAERLRQWHSSQAKKWRWTTSEHITVNIFGYMSIIIWWSWQNDDIWWIRIPPYSTLSIQ